MKVSLATVTELTGLTLPPVDELAERINTQLGGIEEIIDLGARFAGVVIVKVVSAEKHAGADKLSVCRVDDGGITSGVERDADGYVQVVCGAPNVHAGMFAVWLPPGSTVPATYETADPFVLGTRELRGVMSNGMLAAADELGIGTDHAGIIELTPQDLPMNQDNSRLKAGANFAELFKLNDTIIDIENKMFTHRPDCFGQLGVAREISAIVRGLPDDTVDVADTRFVNPDWYWGMPQFLDADSLELTVRNDAVEKVPRFMAVALDHITIAPSPLWLQVELVRMGGKAINNVVDITNYVMLLTGQPLHAYDYDKLAEHTLGVRMGRDGESLPLLNGKTYDVSSDDIVIVDGDKPIGMGGIMGGSNSEVSAVTTRIVLECATFDMYAIRKTSMRHGLFTDAVTRFNKGQSPLQNNRVLAHAMQQLTEVTGATQASAVYDLPDASGKSDEVSLSGEIRISAAFINDRLGSDLTTTQIGNLLRQTNFASYPAEDDDATLLVTAPFWRTDIELPEDIVEEVGRLYGFDALPLELPRRSIAPAPLNQLIELKTRLRRTLARAGANEVLTYSFVHDRLLKNAGQTPDEAYALGNALSPDLQRYRLSLIPSLLDKVHMNIKAGYDNFALFELGKTHRVGDVDGDGLPLERDQLSFVWAAKKTESTPYYTAKRYLELLLPDARYQPLDTFIAEGYDAQLVAPFEPKRSAVVMNGDTFVGVVGEFASSTVRAFKLPPAAGFEVFIPPLLAVQPRPYVPLSRFPSVSKDISLKVPSSTPYQDVLACALGAAKDIPQEQTAYFTPLSIYQPLESNSHKTITLRLELTNYQRTLTDDDAAKILDNVSMAAARSLQAERI